MAAILSTVVSMAWSRRHVIGVTTSGCVAARRHSMTCRGLKANLLTRFFVFIVATRDGPTGEQEEQDKYISSPCFPHTDRPD
uniref:Secreted protein n=1 Tax=Mesocestoides corti TaxID=53468 RepID=A0A5K3FSE5_MESCO